VSGQLNAPAALPTWKKTPVPISELILRRKGTQQLPSKEAVFWVAAPCSLVEVYQRFGGPCCLHHQDDVGSKLLHSATIQKTAIFIIAAMRTSNPNLLRAEFLVPSLNAAVFFHRYRYDGPMLGHICVTARIAPFRT
jgi:hypothetical protein